MTITWDDDNNNVKLDQQGQEPASCSSTTLLGPRMLQQSRDPLEASHWPPQSPETTFVTREPLPPLEQRNLLKTESMGQGEGTAGATGWGEWPAQVQQQALSAAGQQQQQFLSQSKIIAAGIDGLDYLEWDMGTDDMRANEGQRKQLDGDDNQQFHHMCGSLLNLRSRGECFTWSPQYRPSRAEPAPSSGMKVSNIGPREEATAESDFGPAAVLTTTQPGFPAGTLQRFEMMSPRRGRRRSLSSADCSSRYHHHHHHHHHHHPLSGIIDACHYSRGGRPGDGDGINGGHQGSQGSPPGGGYNGVTSDDVQQPVLLDTAADDYDDCCTRSAAFEVKVVDLEQRLARLSKRASMIEKVPTRSSP